MEEQDPGINLEQVLAAMLWQEDGEYFLEDATLVNMDAFDDLVISLWFDQNKMGIQLKLVNRKDIDLE